MVAVLEWSACSGIRKQGIAIGVCERSLRFPATLADILRKRNSLKKELLQQSNLVPTRIAILGGSTTTEVRNMLELFLLATGIQPSFYESGYNRYAEDVLFENPDLWKFKPERSCSFTPLGTMCCNTRN